MVKTSLLLASQSWTAGRSALAAGCLLLAAGCASYSARPLDPRESASAVIERKEVEGLYVAVRDLSSPGESGQIFDRDLLSHGYVPVLLLLELDGQAKNSFDVRREDVRLCLRNGTRMSTEDPSVVADRVSFSHFRSVLAFFLIFPGFFVASSVSTANEQLLLDYQAKAMKSVRINPNMRSYGAALFFPVPRDSEESFALEDAFVELKTYKQGEKEALGKCLEFPVHFAR